MAQTSDGQALGWAEFHDQTTINPVGLSVLAVLVTIIMAAPRRHALFALIACASFIAVGQRVVIFGLDFNFIKVVMLAGWARVMLRQEFRGFRWNTLDGWFVAWVLVSLVAFPLSHGATGIVLKLGTSLEALGIYFLVRMQIRNLNDIDSLASGMAVVSFVVVCFFFTEYVTRHNLFSVMGGVPEITIEREGKFRCQGAYTHPILAGCFWAAIIPLLIGRALRPGGGRYLAIAGIGAAGAIVLMCASSTPLLGCIAGLFGLAVLSIRQYTWVLRWSTVAALAVLQLGMQSPVWNLVARINVVGGSTGWHRFHLIDQFFKHINDWIACGASNITHWGVHKSDLTNQYVAEGIRGGGLTLLCFIIMIAIAFRNVGRMCEAAEHSRTQLIMAWMVGVSLFVHAINFIGVSYFGQIDALWYTSLALTATAPLRVKKTRWATLSISHSPASSMAFCKVP